MKTRWPTVCLLLLFFIGVGLLFYPAVSDYWNSFHQSKAIAGYVQSVSEADTAKQTLLSEEAAQYNRDLAVTGTNFFLSEEDLDRYYRTLDLDGSGMMGYIEIPSIGCSLPIYHGTDDAVLQIAVGHIAGTSLPVGGESSHCVLSGHRGLPSARIFTDLDKLSVGDTFLIRALNTVLTYEVDRSFVVLPSDISSLAIEPGSDLCTLVTCTPYGVNSHRLLVRGRRIAGSGPSTIYITSDALLLDRVLTAPLFAAPLLLIGFLWLTVRTNRQIRRNRVRKKLGLK